ncbi:hypothetical protein AB0N28_03490 [Streptomyces sp. NPDC051130]|uniref:hypothetical protein n=1 Tax=Streptomyces sp. NPDC051130 TaxID=3157223 RepID=UPI003440A53A
MSSRPLHIGDRVVIKSTFHGAHVGVRGRLSAIDFYAEPLEPYHVRDASGRCMWASSVRRCRLQWSDDPGVQALAALALAALVTAALVIYCGHTAKQEPAHPGTWEATYGPTEIIAPYLPPEQRAGHTDRDGERVDFFGGAL